MTQLLTGYQKLTINPPLGIGIDGYFVPRFAKGFLDDITLSAFVLQCGGQTVAIISIDACLMSTAQVARYCEAIEKETGIPKDHVFLTNTHTHTGPLFGPTDAFEAPVEPIREYADFVQTRLTEAVKAALADMVPTKMGYGVGTAPARVAYIRRYKHAALSHQGKQSHGFQRYCLAAGVGAGDYQGFEILAQPYIYGPHRLIGYQGMPSLHYADIATVIQLWLHRPHILCKLSLGEHQIQLAHYPYVFQYFGRMWGNKGGKLCQYALYFLLLLTQQLFVFVAQLYHRSRLNKQRCAAAGLVVDKSRHILAVFLLYGYYKSAVSDCYEGFLKVF